MNDITIEFTTQTIEVDVVEKETTTADITGNINIVNIQGDEVYEETLIGSIDGSNVFFTTTNEYRSGTTRLFINGLLQRRGIDYFERGGNSIELSEPPSNIGFIDELKIMYRGINNVAN